MIDGTCTYLCCICSEFEEFVLLKKNKIMQGNDVDKQNDVVLTEYAIKFIL